MLDPLDILTNIEDVTPHYQPIFSAEEQKIIGYEVLGRIEVESEVQSLGPFFSDPSIPEEYKTEVDLRVIRQALDHFLDSERDLLIFINQDAKCADDGSRRIVPRPFDGVSRKGARTGPFRH